MASRALSLKPEPGAVSDREGQLANRDNLALGIGLLFRVAAGAERKARRFELRLLGPEDGELVLIQLGK